MPGGISSPNLTYLLHLVTAYAILNIQFLSCHAPPRTDSTRTVSARRDHKSRTIVKSTVVKSERIAENLKNPGEKPKNPGEKSRNPGEKSRNPGEKPKKPKSSTDSFASQLVNLGELTFAPLDPSNPDGPDALFFLPREAIERAKTSSWSYVKGHRVHMKTSSRKPYRIYKRGGEGVSINSLCLFWLSQKFVRTEKGQLEAKKYEYDYSVIIVPDEKERDVKEYNFNRARDGKRWIQLQTRNAKTLTLDAGRTQKSPQQAVRKRAETVPITPKATKKVEPAPQKDTDEDDTVEHFLDQIQNGPKLKSHGLPATVAEGKSIARTNPLSQAEILQQQIKNGVSLNPTITVEKGLNPAEMAATAPNTMNDEGDTTLLKIFKNLANIPQDDDSDESVISNANDW